MLTQEKLNKLAELRARIRFSVPIQPGELEAAYARGMLRKSDLEDGSYYRGYCRNATVAQWSAEQNRFFYMRQKFDRRFCDRAAHPEDDYGFDIFVPLEKVTPKEDEIIFPEKIRKS